VVFSLYPGIVLLRVGVRETKEFALAEEMHSGDVELGADGGAEHGFSSPSSSSQQSLSSRGPASSQFHAPPAHLRHANAPRHYGKRRNLQEILIGLHMVPRHGTIRSVSWKDFGLGAF